MFPMARPFGLKEALRMPLTFPSHAAAVIPLQRWVPPLDATALVLGSMAPDASYLVEIFPVSAHSLRGLFLFCLPAAGVLYFAYQLWFVGPLRRSAPNVRHVQLSQWVGQQGLPRTARAWGWVCLSLFLGTLTHLLWDGLTHTQQWPANVLYANIKVALGSRRVWSLPHLLQHLSTVLGTVFVVGWMWHRSRRMPRAQTVPSGDFWRLVTPTLLLVAVGVFWNVHRGPPFERTGEAVWRLVWSAIRYGLCGVALGCGWERWTRVRRASPPPLP